MALKKNFYNEIFEKEQKWIELINKNFLNSIYFSLELKPFYVKKLSELKEEYKLTNNAIIGQIIHIINNIIDQIDLLNNQYKNLQVVDINSLTPLFLTIQMNNSLQNGNSIQNKEFNKINELKKERQLLESELEKYKNSSSNIEDYVYDDFPEDVNYIK